MISSLIIISCITSSTTVCFVILEAIIVCIISSTITSISIGRGYY